MSSNLRAIEPVAAHNGASEGNEAGQCARWYVLLMFGLSSGLQGLLWMTFSSVPEESKEYYSDAHLSDTQLNIILNEGPVAYVLVSAVATYILMSRGGLRSAVGLSCVMCVFAAFYRAIPCWVTVPASISFVYIAQFVNAAAAPLTQSAPSLLSQMWFPLSQRAMATSIARQSNACGRAVGFFLAPALVKVGSDLPHLLYLELAAAGVILLVFLAYFPAEPVTAPSRSAQIMAVQGTERTMTMWGVVMDVLELGRHNVALVVVAFGMQMGMYGAWSGVLPAVLQTMHFSSSEAGTIGAANTFAGICGGVAVGILADQPRIKKRLKVLLLAASLASAIAFLLLALLMPPFNIVPVPFSVIVVVSVISGFLRGTIDPLCFELCAELSYPMNPSVSGTALTLWVHLLMILMLSLPSAFLNEIMMMAMPVTMMVCFLLVLGVQENYRRLLVDTGGTASDSDSDGAGCSESADKQPLVASAKQPLLQ